jgi:hypothetical protein
VKQVARRAAVLAIFFDAGFLLAVFFDPENEGDMSLQNVGCLSVDYTALYPITTAMRTPNFANTFSFSVRNVFGSCRGVK